MGGMHQRDLADNTQNVREMCCHFLFVAHSQGVADGASLLHTTPQPTTLNVLRPSPSPTARSTMQHERVTHSHSSTDQILSTATASSSQQVGVARQFRHKIGGETWEHDLLFDARIDSDSDSGEREMYASLVQDQGPEVRFHPFPRRAADSVPTSTTRHPNKLSLRSPTTRTCDTPNVTRMASSALPLMRPQRRPHDSFRFRQSSVLMDSISSSLTSASPMVVCAAVSRILALRPLRN